jgi:hypothetical protein
MSASEHLAAAGEANARASAEAVEAQKGGASASYHRVMSRRSAELAAEHEFMRCRGARAAVVRDPSDPLAVEGASLLVYRDDLGAAVLQFLSKDADSAREIVRRVAGQLGGDSGWTVLSPSDGDNGLGDRRPREWERDPRPPTGAGTSGPSGPSVFPPPGGPVGRP